MPVTNPFPLGITQKVDNAALLAWLQQFGPQSYLGATDINKILDGLDYLYANSGSLSYDHLVFVGEITIVDDELTMPAGAIWLINNTLYGNASDVVLTIPLTTAGTTRIDYIVADDSNNITLVQGDESDDVVIPPTLPADSVLITSIHVNNITVGTPVPPVTGVEYIKKDEKLSVFNSGTGAIDIDFPDERAIMILNGTVTSVRSAAAILVYHNKKYQIINNQTTAVTIEHLSPSAGEGLLFKFPDEEDFVLDPGEIIEFLFVKTGDFFLRYVGKRYATLSDLTSLQSDVNDALDLKLNITDYNDRFKGVYLTEAALNAAHPTANAGDSAQVNIVGSTDVINYSWDAEDNVWVNNGSGGSGALNTDALPEGTSNLYFTSARVLAVVLTGISFATGGPIVSTDSVLVAFGKLQKQINDLSTIYQAILTPTSLGVLFSTLDGKSSLADDDFINISDSEDSFIQKIISFLNLRISLKDYFDTTYSSLHPRVQTVTSSATVTPTYLNDLVTITAQAAALNLANPTGTFEEGQAMFIRIKDNGTARAITFGSNYRAIGITLPTTTVISKTMYIGVMYNAADSKWDITGISQQA